MSRTYGVLLALAACGGASPPAVEALPSPLPAVDADDTRFDGAEVRATRTGDGWEERTTRPPPPPPGSGPVIGSFDGEGFGLSGIGMGGGGLSGAVGGVAGLGASGSGLGYGASGGRVGAKPGFAREQVAQSLRAGSTDDNAAYGAWLETLATWGARADLRGRFQPMEVGGQQPIRVRDAAGRPVPNAALTLRSGERSIALRTYGDGGAWYRPGLASLSGPLQVTASIANHTVSAAWDGQSPLDLALPVAVAVPNRVPVDAVILLDTTGSMQDEIDAIKATLLGVTRDLEALDRPMDLRWGAVLYRDKGDAYLTRRSALTRDVGAFRTALEGVEAGGGGDTPESLNQGLSEAVGRMDWRPEAARVVFLVADAPPHMDYQGDTPYGDTAVLAAARGIRVHSVAASGLDDAGSLVFRQVAQLTRGRFIFIEYGSFEASAADHGVAAPEQGNNLGAILFQQIKAEVDGWGGDAPVAATKVDQR